ncbi:hypothetical protein H8356DRAFT_1312736 [Neocallimastix lanati (nom. inval.)]|nr:hypothetical protein H8356DRAFT_1312736 [Neocallimastix sp. JGI-2020a]
MKFDISKLLILLTLVAAISGQNSSKQNEAFPSTSKTISVKTLPLTETYCPKRMIACKSGEVLRVQYDKNGCGYGHFKTLPKPECVYRLPRPCSEGEVLKFEEDKNGCSYGVCVRVYTNSAKEPCRKYTTVNCPEGYVLNYKKDNFGCKSPDICVKIGNTTTPTPTPTTSSKAIPNVSTSTKTISTKTFPNKSTSTKTISTKTFPNKFTSTKTISTKTLPNKSTSTKTISTKTLPNKSTSTKTISTKTIPNKSTSTKTVRSTINSLKCIPQVITTTIKETVTVKEIVTVTVQSNQKPTEAPQNCAALYGQCGGIDYKGPTCCQRGNCRELNKYYSQCL